MQLRNILVVAFVGCQDREHVGSGQQADGKHGHDREDHPRDERATRVGHAVRSGRVKVREKVINVLNVPP